MYRVGEGFDVHRLEAGRPLKIGCLEIPAEKGTVGHSDGDALAHAICDAILGSLALGDIGTHFPPSDSRWEGMDSQVFLAHAAKMATDRGARIINVDATVLLERPKLAPHMDEIRRGLASVLGCLPSQVSVKAKTGEGLGLVGEGKVIEARAVVLVEVPS